MFNVGVYGVPAGGCAFDPLVLNSMLESTVTQLEGRKMLYAQSFYSEQEWWRLFDADAYSRCRKMYGGEGSFPDMTAKLLLPTEKRMTYSGTKWVSLLSSPRCFLALIDWYLELWIELLLPQSWAPLAGLQHTRAIAYKPADHFYQPGTAASPSS